MFTYKCKYLHLKYKYKYKYLKTVYSSTTRVQVQVPSTTYLPYICQMPGHRLSRLAKGTPSESRFSIGTIDLG